MFRDLSLAWRGIWRSRRRTLINVSAVAFGLALLLLGAGMMEGFMKEAQNDLSHTGMGHLEIYRGDYRLKRDVRLHIVEPQALVDQVAAQAPPGSHVGWRVVAQALVSSAWGSRGVRLLGVDPALEAPLSRFFTQISQGEALQKGDERGIIIGEGLARRLKVKVKSKLRVMAQRADGEVGAELFRVRGIFHAISPTIGDSQAFVDAQAAQRLLGIGPVAHQVIAQLPQAADSEPLAAALRAELGQGHEVLSFSELFPTLKFFQEYIDRMLIISVFAIYFLVGLGVLNTMLMGVMERTREFGVMMAVGTRRWRLVSLVFGEAFWIATIGVLAGLAMGLALNWLCATYGLLDWRASAGEGMDFAGTTMSMVLTPDLSAPRAALAALVVWTLTLLVGLYPAWRVSRLLPADALRAG